MKLCFPILALFFLTGCPNPEIPPVSPEGTGKPEGSTAGDKPNSYHEAVPNEQFGLKALLQKPIEDLPAGIPPVSPVGTEKPDERKAEDKPNCDHEAVVNVQFGSEVIPDVIDESTWSIDPDISFDDLVSLGSLRGIWYGKVRQQNGNVQRIYVQFESDKSFSYGCAGLNSTSYAGASLLSGVYAVPASGNLQLQAKFYIEDTYTRTVTANLLSKFVTECGGYDWDLTEGIITVLARQLDSNTVVLFNKDFSYARAFLVRK